MEQRRFYSWFVKQYNLEPKKLFFSDTAREIAVTCKEELGMNQMYVCARDQLFLYWEKLFLIAVKQKR